MERIEEIKNKSKKSIISKGISSESKGVRVEFSGKIAGKNSREKIILQLNNTLEFELGEFILFVILKKFKELFSSLPLVYLLKLAF